MTEKTTSARYTNTTIKWKRKLQVNEILEQQSIDRPNSAQDINANLATEETTSKEILTQQPNDTENYQWTK